MSASNKTGAVGWRSKVYLGSSEIGEARDPNIDTTRGTIDTTAQDTDGWYDYEAGLASWTGSFTLIYKYSGSGGLGAQANALRASVENGTSVSNFRLQLQDGYSVSGAIVVTAMNLTATFEGAVQYAVTFSGKGRPNITLGAGGQPSPAPMTAPAEEPLSAEFNPADDLPMAA